MDFWNWKTEDAVEWDYLKLKEANLSLPLSTTTRTSKQMDLSKKNSHPLYQHRHFQEQRHRFCPPLRLPGRVRMLQFLINEQLRSYYQSKI